MKRLVCFGLIPLTLLLGACGSAPVTRSAPVAPAADDIVPPPDGPSGPLDDDLVDPLNAWFANGLSSAELAALEDAAVEDCMAAQGLVWTAPPDPAGPDLTRGGTRKFRLTSGYGIGKNSYRPDNDSNQAVMAKLSEADLERYLTALEGPFVNGDRNGGCRRTAHDTTFAVITERAKDTAAGEAWQAALNDPRALAAEVAWQDCMGDRGVKPPTDPRSMPSAAIDQVIAVSDAQAARRLELDIAAADVECSAAHLWDVWFEIGTEALARLG